MCCVVFVEYQQHFHDGSLLYVFMLNLIVLARYKCWLPPIRLLSSSELACGGGDISFDRVHVMAFLFSFSLPPSLPLSASLPNLSLTDSILIFSNSPSSRAVYEIRIFLLSGKFQFFFLPFSRIFFRAYVGCKSLYDWLFLLNLNFHI